MVSTSAELGLFRDLITRIDIAQDAFTYLPDLMVCAGSWQIQASWPQGGRSPGLKLSFDGALYCLSAWRDEAERSQPAIEVSGGELHAEHFERSARFVHLLPDDDSEFQRLMAALDLS